MESRKVKNDPARQIIALAGVMIKKLQGIVDTYDQGETKQKDDDSLEIFNGSSKETGKEFLARILAGGDTNDAPSPLASKTPDNRAESMDKEIDDSLVAIEADKKELMAVLNGIKNKTNAQP